MNVFLIENAIKINIGTANLVVVATTFAKVLVSFSGRYFTVSVKQATR